MIKRIKCITCAIKHKDLDFHKENTKIKHAQKVNGSKYERYRVGYPRNFRQPNPFINIINKPV